MIQELTATAELNKTYLGKVQRITDFGAFVEIMPGTDGLLHVSEIANYRVKDVRDELKEGQQVLVKVINIDPTGKIRLSRKALITPEEGSAPPAQASRRRRRRRRAARRRRSRRPAARGDRDRGPAPRPRPAAIDATVDAPIADWALDCRTRAAELSAKPEACNGPMRVLRVHRAHAGATAPLRSRRQNRREFTIVAQGSRLHAQHARGLAGRPRQDHPAQRGRPHSFAIDAYRIVKRAGRRQAITFEFRADQPGTFTFYCNLTTDPRLPGDEGHAGGQARDKSRRASWFYLFYLRGNLIGVVGEQRVDAQRVEVVRHFGRRRP